MLALSLKLGLQALQLGVVALHLSLEHILLEAALGDLLLELTVLRDEQLFLAVDFLDHFAVL